MAQLSVSIKDMSIFEELLTLLKFAIDHSTPEVKHLMLAKMRASGFCDDDDESYEFRDLTE